MSFLSRTTPMLRTSTVSLTTQSTRLFATSLAQRNVVKDTAKKVDRTVSDQLVKGIDKGSTFHPLQSTIITHTLTPPPFSFFPSTHAVPSPRKNQIANAVLQSKPKTKPPRPPA